MLDINKRLFSLFIQNEVIYCNWKGTAKIEDALDGKGDIDILVSNQSKAIAESLLRKAGFINVRTQWECRFKAIYDWLGCDSATGVIVHVHLHFRMIAGHPSFMEYTLPWADVVLANRELLNNGVYTISPEWELLVFFTRLGLEYPNKKISNKSGVFNESGLAEYKYLQERVEFNFFKQLAFDYLKVDSANLYLSLIKKDNLSTEDFFQLQRIVIKENKGLFYNRLFKNLSLLKIVYIRKIVARFKSILFIPTKKTIPHGIVVAFLGQDGSGKSTVTKDIECWLNNKMEVERFYLGSGKEYYYPWQRKLLDKLEKSNSLWLKPIRSWLYFSEMLASSRYVYRTIKKANKYVQHGGIALFDRFPQIDYYGINDGPKIRVTLLNKVPKGFMWLAKCYAWKEEKYLKKAVNNAPDMVFKLLLSPEVSKQRKPFENFEMIKQKHDIIKALSFPSSQVEIIDAEQPYSNEILMIKKIIWKRIKQ